MSIYSPSTLSASAPALRSLALSNAANVILTTFTDAGGLTFALNWALYIARSGQRPTIGLDGPPPRQASAQWDQTNALAYKLPAAGGHAASNGLARWTLRWVGLARLLDLGINVLLSDTDVVWLRNPAPYFAAVLALHPLLDVALGTDHATYAEVFRDDVLYSSTEPPTRRALLARWQRVNSSRSATADVSEQMFSPSVLDFDLDPYPANGARDGTWNPGVLFARSTVGGRAFVQAELAELAAAGTNLGARGLKDAVEVSDQSEMCRLLQQLMLSDAGEGWTGLDHARHPLDTSLLQVPLELQPEAAAAAAQAATFGLDAADVTLPWACDGTLAMEPDSRRGWRRRGRGKRRGGGSGATLALRDAVAAGELPGPRIIDAGRSISTTSGHMDATLSVSEDLHGSIGQENLCDGVESCRQAVRKQIRRGVDVIKIATTGGVNSRIGSGLGRQIFDDEVKALVDTAHLYGKKVAVHAHSDDGINAALAVGADSIEHGTMLTDETLNCSKRQAHIMSRHCRR